jgi:hypothetical protein
VQRGGHRLVHKRYLKLMTTLGAHLPHMSAIAGGPKP